MKIGGVAERGYPLRYPENTLSSFQAAIDLNFSHTKLEVHLTKDGVPVVIRDANINRVTSGYGEIKDYTYAELLRYTVNHDERIPTLEEVLHLTKGKIKTGIDIKLSGFYRGLEEKVYDIILKLDCLHDCFILSSNHHSLAKMRMLSRDIQLGLSTEETHPHDYHLLKELKANFYYVRFQFDILSVLDREPLKQMGIQMIVGTVSTMEEMKFMKNYPEFLVATTELEKFQAISYPETIKDWQKVGI